MDSFDMPFGGIASLLPTCFGHDDAGQAVRGAGSHPHIIGASADARPTMGGCPASCSSRCALSLRSRRRAGRAGANRVDSSPVEVRGMGHSL